MSRFKVKRFGIATAVVVAATFAFALPASALTVRQQPVNGSFTGTATIVFYTAPSCPSGILLDMTATGDLAPFGPSSLALHICDRRLAGDTLQSSFTLTAADGTVSGAVPNYLVTVALPPQAATFHFDLTVDSGTGRFESAAGAIALDGFFNLAPLPPVTGTASGAVTFGPPVPTTKQDCKHGGWRNVADTRGRPFKNQGRCLRVS